MSSIGITRLASAFAQATQTHPRPDTLRAGDLLWTRAPEKCVPYDKTLNVDTDAEARWRKMQSDLTQKAKASGDDLLLLATQRLSTMSEDQFNALYLDNQPLDSGVKYSGARFAVGHVAVVGSSPRDGLYIVEATTPDSAGAIQILEQCFDDGVKQTKYPDWIKARSYELIWHGRPYPALADTERAKIPTEALKYLGRPYCFDKLNLSDTSGFYCSKLVWLSIREALNRVVDDDPNPRRSFWLSPKQVLESKNVNVLFSPGEYGCFGL
jgi:hypothetical protein